MGKSQLFAAQVIDHIRRDSARTYPVGLTVSEMPSFLIDAEIFGSPSHFNLFAIALDAAVVWPKRRVRVAVCSLGWATDAEMEQWSSMKWGLIVAKPRPISLSDLSAVRRLARQGPLEIFPNYDSHLPR